MPCPYAIMASAAHSLVKINQQRASDLSSCPALGQQNTHTHTHTHTHGQTYKRLSHTRWTCRCRLKSAKSKQSQLPMPWSSMCCTCDSRYLGNISACVHACMCGRVDVLHVCMCECVHVCNMSICMHVCNIHAPHTHTHTHTHMQHMCQ
jgi:hypothetical protein